MKATFVFLAMLALAVIGWFVVVPQKASNLLIKDAVAQPISEGVLGVVLGINNQGEPDRLLSVSSDTGDAAFHYIGANDDLPIQSGHSSLALDAAHIRLKDVSNDLAEGTLLPLTLTFQNAGEIAIKARFMATAIDMHAGHAGMQDMPMMDPGEPAPSVSIAASPDQNGWRITISATDFIFSQEQADKAHVSGVGHGHVYVGGVKLGRVFDAEYMTGQLPSGSHEIRVTLNTNDHRAYMVDGQPISATTRIVVD